MRGLVIEMRQMLPERRDLVHLVHKQVDEILRDEVADTERHVQAGVGSGQRIVVLAVGDIEQVAGGHGHFLLHRALGLLVILALVVGRSGAGHLGRVLHPALVDPPDLGTGEVAGKDVLRVEMG